MACKPKPQLRMADGGELMRRFANRQPVRMLDGTPENMAQNTTPMSAQDAGAFAAMGGPQGVAPDAPAAAPAADPGRRQRMLDAGQRTQTFMPTMGNIQTEVFDPHIRQLALRDGGTVPGKGTGDKIPALYEPGEFVVSNAMLDAEPGLREQLHDLRGNVLAAQGKSVEQADAQAVKGGTLRAASGGALPELPSLDFLDKRPAPAPAPAPNLTAMNQPGVDSRNAQFAERSAYEARAAREANPRSMTTKELFSRGDGSVRGSSPLRFNPPGMGPNGVVQTANAPRSMTRAELFNQPKSPIPNNPAGPLKLPTPVAAEPTGRVAKGLAWVDDAMSAAAKSKFVAPVLGALRSPLGQAVGKLGGVGAQLALHHGDAGAPTLDDERVAAMGRPYDPDWQPRSKPYTPRPDSVAPWGNELRRNSPMAGVNGPTAPARGTDDFTKALSTVPDQLPAGLRDGMVYKTKDAKGNVTYSGRNVSGDVSGRMLNGDGTSAGKMRGSLRVAAGVPVMGPNGSYVIDDQAPTGEAKQAQINATLRNPDGSKWSARDNAVMAANLRDGVDPYRGTSRAPKEEDRIPAIGEFGHNRAVAAKLARDQLKATLRGQDLEMERGRLTAQAAQRKNEFDMNRDIRKDAREQETHAQAVGDKAREGFVKEFGAFNPDGTPNQGLTAAKISAMQRLFPGIDMTSPEGRSKHLPDAQSTAKIYERIASNPQMGMDKLITAKGPGYDAMPDWKGATLKQQGYVGGKLTPGSEPNGWYITHNRVDTPLGADLSQRELEIIRHATKTGSWRGAPKNTQ